MQAFIYCWTDHISNKLYIGSHVGTETDGYICSSKPMLKEYKKRPTDFSRQIIAHGNENDIRNLETQLLVAADAANDPVFYNLNNHSQPQKSGWRHSEDARHLMSEAGRRRRGEKRSAAARESYRQRMLGTKFSDETRQKMSASRMGRPATTAGRRWYTNGKNDVFGGPVPPDGYVPGRSAHVGRRAS